MLRYLIDKMTLFLGWLYRHQRIRIPSNQAIKVNLGCGLSVVPGWINIDGSINALIAPHPFWVLAIIYRFSGARQYNSLDDYCRILRNHYFVYHNLKYGIPIENSQVDFIYSSHFLEHLDRLSGQRLLEECLRVLKPGGVIRISVPDLACAWELYQRGEKARMLHDYFFVEEAPGFSQHRYAYDFEILQTLLHDVGFVDVQRMTYQQGRMPDIEILDNREEYSLFVEACRPTSNGLKNTTDAGRQVTM
jgi:predicted SAM-dependent methyltransferase